MLAHLMKALKEVPNDTSFRQLVKGRVMHEAPHLKAPASPPVSTRR